MDTLLTIANRAKIRLQLNATLRHSTMWLLSLSVLALLLALVDRVGDVSFIPWSMILVGFLITAVLVAITNWSRQSISKVEAAAEVDHRMHLRDRISSAIACNQQNNPYCAALMIDANTIIKKEHVQSKLAHYFSIVIPREFGMVFAIIAAALFVIWSPQWGLWPDPEKQSLQTALIPTRENIESSIDAVLEQIREDEALGASLEEELAELLAITAIENQDPETLRREALRKMTDLQERLDELINSVDALALEEVSRRLQTLKLPRSSDTLPLVAALKNGNFDQANKELKALQEQMDSLTMTEEEREELAKALEALGEQLAQLASANQALASALSAAGMNGALASNLDAAMKAINNAKDLTEAQKKKLLELLKSQQKASQSCKNMSSGCKQFSLGEGGKAMANELEQLQAMKMFKTRAQMAKSACQKAGMGMCAKPGSGSGTGTGSTGGAGQGNGGMNRVEETETTSVAERSPVHTLEGSIIARQLFEGGLLTTSESKVAVRELIAAERRSMEQAIADEEVPRKYHDLLRHYFGQFDELTKTVGDDANENSD